MGETATVVAQRRETRLVECGLTLDEGSYGLTAGDRRHSKVELSLPSLGRGGSGDQVDQFGVPQQRSEICTGLSGGDMGGGAGDLAQQAVAQESLQQASRWGSGDGVWSLGNQVRDGRRCEKGADVVRRETSRCRDAAGLDQRPGHGPSELSEGGLRQSRSPRQPKAGGEGGGDGVLGGDETLGLQVLAQEGAQVLQIVAPHNRAEAVTAGDPVGLHDVGEVGVGIRWRTSAQPRDLGELGTPDLVA